MALIHYQSELCNLGCVQYEPEIPDTVIMIKYISVYFRTRLNEVFPSRKVLHFNVSEVASLGVNGGFGEFILKSLQVLCTRYAVLSFRKHADNAITVGRGATSGLATKLLTVLCMFIDESPPLCGNAGVRNVVIKHFVV